VTAWWRAFERWLFTPQAGQRLAWFRIGWSLAMFVASGVELTRTPQYAAQHYHLPLFEWLVVPTEESTVRFVLWCAVVASVSAGMGLLARLAVLVVVIAHGWLFVSDLLQFRNHIYLALLLGALLCTTPCGAWLGADAFLRRAALPARTPLPAVQLIKAQVLIVYAAAGLNKLRGSFLNGFTLQEELPFVLRDGVLAPWLFLPDGALSAGAASWLGNRVLLGALALGVLLVELGLALGLPRPSLRNYAVGLGIAMHAAIGLSMNVFTFGLLLVASYPLFESETGSAP
jgi:hypothetical protein